MYSLNYPLSFTNFKVFYSTSNFSFTSLPVHLRFIWLPHISYSAWHNFLRSYLWFIGKTKSFLKESPFKMRKFFKLISGRKSKIVNSHIQIMVEKLKSCESAEIKQSNNEDIKISLITMLKQFCERKCISQRMNEIIQDSRNQQLITYSKESIMMSALAIFLFRMGSGNKFDGKTHDNDEKYSKANIAKFIGAPESQVPVIKTIEEFLVHLKENSINQLMIAFFKDLQNSKFFVQHPQIMPGEFFLLAIDCVHTHTYNHPHHVDSNGNNDCECCLKRVHNKGTDKEYVQWQHLNLIFSFVFMGGLKIPIYSYPIHAKQITNLESASEDSYKQECELVGLKIALPTIREAFPKMKIVLLLDGLYANRPVIRLVEEQRCGYIIVRKQACLPLLAIECDACALNTNHRKNCTKKTNKMYKGWLIEQEYEWFNSKYLGEGVSTNVLRFIEIRTNEKKEKVECYKCEWLFSWKLSWNNCEFSALQARSRWEIEDLFNSLKQRGYRLKHDYSRNPLSCFHWQSLALFAFGIFELFRFSESVQTRGNWTQTALAEKLLGQLIHSPTEEIFSNRCLSKRIQFRYHFIVELVLSCQVHQSYDLTGYNTG